MISSNNTLRTDVHVIGLVGLMHGVSHFFQLALPPLFVFIKGDLGVGYAQLGVLITCYYAVSGVGQAAAGFVVDRVGAARVLVYGLLLIVAGAAVAACASSYGALLAAVVLMAVGNCIFHPADFAVLNHRVTPSRLGHAFSTHGLAGNLGYASAPIAMLALGSAWGWHAAMACAALLGAMFAVFVWTQRGVLEFELAQRDAAHGQRKAGVAGTFAPLMTLSIASCFVFFICSSYASVGMQSFAPAMLAAAYGLTPLAGATLLTAFLLSSAAGILVGGFVASSIAHHERAAALGMAGGAVTFALLATSSPPVGLLGPLLCAGGFALGTAYPSRDMLVRAAAPKGAIGRTFGVVYCGTDIGAALGPGAIGWLLDHGRPDWSFLSVALVLAANIVLAYQATRRRIQPVTLPA